MAALMLDNSVFKILLYETFTIIYQYFLAVSFFFEIFILQNIFITILKDCIFTTIFVLNTALICIFMHTKHMS